MKFADRREITDTLRMWLERAEAGVQIDQRGGPFPQGFITLVRDNAKDPAVSPGPPGPP